jgi:hypothetical protein
MSSLQIVKVCFMNPNGFFQLLDVLRSAFSEGGLGLAIPLLAFLGGCIYRLAPTLPLLLSRYVLLRSSSFGLGSWRVKLHGVLRGLSERFFFVN